ncbi:DUF2069 domain-containing protein [Inhella gelatinilytica]|uniref:DUF2069 domain-containing protein n=1 Tax=Inhella gelatinilytica TaxID=2795030 RepID=A0A931IXR5_9BURK|nr:DUF2069 domain-containing protein [Inhella gelatinilytica]MBH9553842.1 DUF2069 domain-containing protein [Inhella gelatinilytica]
MDTLSPVSNSNPPSARARGSRSATLTAVVALIALGVLWETLWAPTGSGRLAIKVLPLCLALPGLLRYRLYTYRWLALLVWLYIAEGLVRGPSGVGVEAALGWIEVLLGCLVFGSATAHIRWRLADGRAQTESA